VERRVPCRSYLPPVSQDVPIHSDLDRRRPP
jgi:hypothetical protein